MYYSSFLLCFNKTKLQSDFSRGSRSQQNQVPTFMGMPIPKTGLEDAAKSKDEPEQINPKWLPKKQDFFES